MSVPKNIQCPCDGDARYGLMPYWDGKRDLLKSCCSCVKHHDFGGKCLGSDGWPLYHTAAEVAREQIKELSAALDLAIADTDDAERRLEKERERNAKLEQAVEALRLLERNEGWQWSETTAGIVAKALAAIEETP